MDETGSSRRVPGDERRRGRRPRRMTRSKSPCSRRTASSARTSTAGMTRNLRHPYSPDVSSGISRPLCLLFRLRCHVNMLPSTTAAGLEAAYVGGLERDGEGAVTQLGEHGDQRSLRDDPRRCATLDEAERFFRDLCTLAELEAMAHRWQVARLVDEGLPYHEVSRRTGASTTTVTRVAHWLRHGEEGYRLALDRRKTALERLKIAIPAKGRLREPTVVAARGGGARAGGARRAGACLPLPECSRRGAARPRRRRPRVRPRRRRRLWRYRSRSRSGARRACRGAPAARLRKLHARGGRPAGVTGAVARRPRTV